MGLNYSYERCDPLESHLLACVLSSYDLSGTVVYYLGKIILMKSLTGLIAWPTLLA